MMKALSIAFYIAKKDFRIEWRRKELVFTSVFFSMLVVLICAFGFYTSPALAFQIVSGVLWLAILFSGILIMGRIWASEKDFGNLQGLLLCPISSWSLYLGKMVSAWVLISLVEIVILPWIWLLFPSVSFEKPMFILLIIMLGTWGFVCVGTLFSALSAKSGTQDFMLSTILFPLLSPVLLTSVMATRRIFEGASLGQIYDLLRILIVFDLVFFTVSSVLFDYVIREK